MSYETVDANFEAKIQKVKSQIIEGIRNLGDHITFRTDTVPNLFVLVGDSGEIKYLGSTQSGLELSRMRQDQDNMIKFSVTAKVATDTINGKITISMIKIYHTDNIEFGSAISESMRRIFTEALGRMNEVVIEGA